MNLQGHVAVYTEPGEGTLVTCTLPRQTELKDEVIRLLVVDDQPLSVIACGLCWRSSTICRLSGRQRMGSKRLSCAGRFSRSWCLWIWTCQMWMDLRVPYDKRNVASHPYSDPHHVRGYQAGSGGDAKRGGWILVEIHAAVRAC